MFTHSFAPNPSCSPSRSLLLSGQEAHRLGEAASLYGNVAPDVRLIRACLKRAAIWWASLTKGGVQVFPRRPDGSIILQAYRIQILAFF